LTNTFAAVDQDGKPFAVDENGKPLVAQPLLQTLMINGKCVIRAYSASAGKWILVGFYLPKSGGSSTSQYLWK
jgi:hypothetical protein